MENMLANLIDQIGQPALVLAVPLVIAGIKKAISTLPKWALPALAPLIAILGDFVVGLVTGVSIASPFVAALLGLAGTGLREVVDQLKKFYGKA